MQPGIPIGTAGAVPSTERSGPYLLYAVLRAAERSRIAAPDSATLQGVCGQPLFFIRSGELDVAASPLDDTAPVHQPGTTEVMEYESVIAALHTRFDVLPLRFGCMCADANDARGLLFTHHATYLSLLSSVGGCTEMSISILYEDPELPPQLPARDRTLSGADYLRARLQRQRQQDETTARAEALASECSAGLRPWFVKHRIEVPTSRLPSGSPLPLAIHFLVQRHDAGSFRVAFRRLQQFFPVPMLLSGPWPPYNFAA